MPASPIKQGLSNGLNMNGNANFMPFSHEIDLCTPTPSSSGDPLSAADFFGLNRSHSTYSTHQPLSPQSLNGSNNNGEDDVFFKCDDRKGHKFPSPIGYPKRSPIGSASSGSPGLDAFSNKRSSNSPCDSDISCNSFDSLPHEYNSSNLLSPYTAQGLHNLMLLSSLNEGEQQQQRTPSRDTQAQVTFPPPAQLQQQRSSPSPPNPNLATATSGLPSMSIEETVLLLRTVLEQLNNLSPPPPPPADENTLNAAAITHRTAANSTKQEASFAWCGKLPLRLQTGETYSSKVFLGGVPWDVTEDMLIYTFSRFGEVKVEWPGKEASIATPKGYAYLIFENEAQVKRLIDECKKSSGGGGVGRYYYPMLTKRFKTKDIQIIPWSISDSNYAPSSQGSFHMQKLDPQKTVFVGALHGMLNAEGLFTVMNTLFGGVLYAGIDTDKNKYPIGSGRVTFNNYHSYKKAVAAGFVDIKTPRFNKKVQIDPYLEDTPCSLCNIQKGPYFCRDNACFRYFCTACWQVQHSGANMTHKPLMRNSKQAQLAYGMVSHQT